VTYKLTNDSQNIPDDATNLLGMEIAFEKTSLQKANSISTINENGGKVTMGYQSALKSVQWRCFAYSTDGTTWTKLDSGESIPATAKYGYFVLDEYVSSLGSQLFLASEKINSSYESSTYSTKSKYSQNFVSGPILNVTPPGDAWHNDLGDISVCGNDYYYSDVRQTLKKIETALSINLDSEIYNAIQGRSISDLYKNMSSSGEDVAAPTNADMKEEDKFWLMSEKELQDFFADNNARRFLNPNVLNGYIYTNYWLRSPHSGTTNGVKYVTIGGSCAGCGVEESGMLFALRPAFKLQFA